MFKKTARLLATAAFGAAIALSNAGSARAANPSMLKDFNFDHPIFIHPAPFGKKHLVVQVSQGNPKRWNLALNSVQNILDYFGEERVQIVVVAFGPGLGMLLAKSPDAERIASMNAEGIEFDACHNTMMGIERATGHMPVLLPSAVIVPAGAVRIMQLEAHGFTYLKP